MPPTRKGFEFYEKDLKSARYVVAPMVEGSELAWRLISRRHGAELCYTPMLHAGVFVRDEKYRIENLQTCPEDRPLIVQFCANDPDTFKKAVDYTVQLIDCDAVDLNLGCPQVIAKRGHFGAFLQDEWELLTKMVSTIHDNFSLPITCKTRIFPEVEKSIAYAQMLEAAGCQLLTVHGRTREQKGPMTGLASWEHIAAVAKAVKIPVFANGNIQYFADVERCLKVTGVQGVMTAEGNLHNPALFDEAYSENPPEAWRMCEEYLALVDQYPCPLSYSRGHIFKMLHHLLQLPKNFDVREIIAKGKSVEKFKEAVAIIKARYESKPEAEAKVEGLRYPPWICQPYVRPTPEEYVKKMADIKEKQQKQMKRPSPSAADDAAINDDDDAEATTNNGQLSKRKQKKLERNPKMKFRQNSRENVAICVSCPNPSGLKCESKLCRKCCREKCFKEELDCYGHKIQVKSKRDAARKYNSDDGKNQPEASCCEKSGQAESVSSQTNNVEAMNEDENKVCENQQLQTPTLS